MATSAELFNSLLQESLKESNTVISNNATMKETIKETGNYEYICLITGEKLREYYITLECNHTFNYIPLMNEVRQWKSNYKNKSYCYKYKISLDRQIVCPYCRSVSNGLLPWVKQINNKAVLKKRWVNHPAPYSMAPNKCVYKFKTGNRKGNCCSKPCYYNVCSTHMKYKNDYDKNGNLKKAINNPTKKKTSVLSGKCQHKLLRGNRKGLCCDKKAKKYMNNGNIVYYCSAHVKKYNGSNQLTDV